MAAFSKGCWCFRKLNFDRVFPEQAGYSYFLMETPPGTKEELSNLLESDLHDYGFDAESVGRRLESFLEVQNTYFSTFQALGGLGLLLGTLGLATVMLRNVLERRSELALLRAVGFFNSRLVVLVLVENAFLLIWGLLAGTISALVAMAPHLVTIGADVPWETVAAILGAVAVVGMLAALWRCTKPSALRCLPPYGRSRRRGGFPAPKGHHRSAQGRAKRRPGFRGLAKSKALKGRNKTFGSLCRPFRAWFVLANQSQGDARGCRHIALPWAILFCPVGGTIVEKKHTTSKDASEG